MPLVSPGGPLGSGLEAFGLAPNVLVIEPVNVPAAAVTLNFFSIDLQARSLPYQGVEWGVRQRNKITWYQGNPVATVQVLGPEEMPTIMRGMFKDRFLGVGAAKRLVAKLDKLCRSGLLCKVSWGPNIRFGILEEFKPNFIRRQDIEWEMRWLWTSRDQSFVAAAINAVFDAIDAVKDLVNQFNQLAEAIRNLGNFIESFAKEVTDTLHDLENIVPNLEAAVKDVGKSSVVAKDTAVRFLNQSSTAKALGLKIKDHADKLDDVTSQPSTPLAPNLGQATVKLNQLRNDVLLPLREFLAILLALDKLFLPLAAINQPQSTVAARDGQTLRDISRENYGTTRNWPAIADANKLSDANVKAGQILTLPKRT